ncbi:MAG: SUMF1/EgtB/PvdO family nonheme iron enzyme [Woeseiaceae bacterium]
MSLLGELQRRKVFRVAAGYVVFAWVLIQVVETIFPAFGLDIAAFRMLVIVLAVGFVPAVILSWAFELTRGGLVPERSAAESAREPQTPSVASVLRQPKFAVPLTLAALTAIGTIVLLSMQLMDSRKARLELLPQIESLVAANDIDGAFALAQEAEKDLPGDPLLERLWSDIAVRMSFISEPAGADVFYKRYSDVDSDWELLGTTPLEDVRLPRAVLRWRLHKTGYEAAERAGEAFDGIYRLHLPEGSLDEDMVRVPASQRYFLLTGYSPFLYDVPMFRADRFETTNEDYLEFVRAGGYEDEAYWSELGFERDGTEISWNDAVDVFRDRTGRYGPAGWEGGMYPQGTERLPVSGISWYEAAAYARFRGKQLPTIYHWSSMTIFPSREEIETTKGSRPGFGLFRSELAALSNFSNNGAAEVGSHKSVAPFGTYDAAGNVREWCWNATGDGGERYILGGSSQDLTYLYTYGVAKSPWDRSAVNGVRLVSYEAGDDSIAALREDMPLPASESLTPISDEVFQVYRDLFDYDRTPLNTRTESAAVDEGYWTRETVSFDATYGDERVLAHVFLPKNIEPPYQVVVYYPSSDAIFRQSSDDLELEFVDFIIQSGRAVVFPVLWGTYERNVNLDTTWPKATREYSNHVVQWIQDFRRTVDYLETRPDMDLERLGFYGLSWGGWNGPIVLALDKRFATGAFLSGGIPPTLARPEASSASFASRVSQPVLMISGEHDVIRPVATYQAPMFASLCTPADLKRHAILSGGHLPPEGEVIAEVLAWFDRYLGEVE